MATYAVGDVQGCLTELNLLLNRIEFSSSDKVVFLGDLVNRGPDSLGVLRLVRSLGKQAVVVLGNHDLHLLAILFGGHQEKASDTLTKIVEAKDSEDIGHWLRKQHLIYRDSLLDCVMVHAGIPFFWSIEQTFALAKEVETVISGEEGANPVDFRIFFKLMYGNDPNYWSKNLVGIDRYRVIVSFLTRMRFLDQSGSLDFSQKGNSPGSSSGLVPWFSFYDEKKLTGRFLFGHWASLDGVTGNRSILALDTGCVWGRSLTAYCLDTGERLSVQAAE